MGRPQSHIKCAVDEFLTSVKAGLAISVAVADTLILATAVYALFVALKGQEAYKQHMKACGVPVAERIVPEYAASSQPATTTRRATSLSPAIWRLVSRPLDQQRKQSSYWPSALLRTPSVSLLYRE